MSPCDLTQEPYGHCGNALGDYLRSVGHGKWKMRPGVSTSGGGVTLKMQLSGSRLVGSFLWLNQPLVSLKKALLNRSFVGTFGGQWLTIMIFQGTLDEDMWILRAEICTSCAKFK